MVKYKHLFKAVELYVDKCSVTLKEIKSHISSIVHEIAYNKEDEEILLDRISHFYRDTYNKPKEHLIIMDHNGNEWLSESDDDYNAVEVPEEAYEEGQRNGLLFSMHNHPDGSSFPSPDDNTLNVEQNEEYSVIIGKNEISITRQNTTPDDSSLVEYINTQHYFKHFNKMRESNYDGIKDITEKISDGKIPVEDGKKELNKRINGYVRENMSEMVEDLNEMYIKNDLDINTTYIQW